MGVCGGKWLLKDQGGGLTSRSLVRGQGGAGAAQDQPPLAGCGGGSAELGALSTSGCIPSATGCWWRQSPASLVSLLMAQGHPSRRQFPLCKAEGLSHATTNVPFGVQGTLSGAPACSDVSQAELSLPKGRTALSLPTSLEKGCSRHMDRAGHVAVSISPRQRCPRAATVAPTPAAPSEAMYLRLCVRSPYTSIGASIHADYTYGTMCYVPCACGIYTSALKHILTLPYAHRHSIHACRHIIHAHKYSIHAHRHTRRTNRHLIHAHRHTVCAHRHCTCTWTTYTCTQTLYMHTDTIHAHRHARHAHRLCPHTNSPFTNTQHVHALAWVDLPMLTRSVTRAHRVYTRILLLPCMSLHAHKRWCEVAGTEQSAS